METIKPDRPNPPQWNRDYILSILPGAADIFDAAGQADVERITAFYRNFFHAAAQQCHRFNANPLAAGRASLTDAVQVKSFLEDYGQLEELFARFVMFNAAMHFYDPTMQPLIMQAMGSLQPEMNTTNILLLQARKVRSEVCHALDERTMQDATLTKYLPLIRGELETPLPPPDAAEILQEANALALFSSQEMRANMQAQDPAGRARFAEGLAAMVRTQNLVAQASGYDNAPAKFYHTNRIDAAMTDRVGAALQRRARPMSEGMAMLMHRQMQTKDRIYSWADARQIVIAAYSKLGPEFEQLVRDAFDSGNIHYSAAAPVPAVVPGIVRSEAGDGHGLLVTNYAGTSRDLIFLGHEMGHYLAEHFALSTQPQGSATHTMMVHEAFSHFGEELMRDAMLEHAQTADERTAIDAECCVKKIQTLHAAAQMMWEKKIYDRAISGELPYTADELDKLMADCLRNYMGLTEDEMSAVDAREESGLMEMMAQPLNFGVYPPNVLAAGALKEACDRDPIAFGVSLKQIMQRGNDVGINELWDTLLGNDVARDQAFFERCVEKLFEQIEHANSPRRADAFKQPRPNPSDIRPESSHIRDRTGRARGIDSQD